MPSSRLGERRMARGYELDLLLVFSCMCSSIRSIPVLALRYRETALYGNLILKKGVIGSTGE